MARINTKKFIWKEGDLKLVSSDPNFKPTLEQLEKAERDFAMMEGIIERWNAKKEREAAARDEGRNKDESGSDNSLNPTDIDSGLERE